MGNKTIFGIIYVSTWVIIWGSIGSLIDFPLLKVEVYTPGSLGQVLTFLISSIFAILSAIYLFPKIIEKEFIKKGFKLDLAKNKNN